MFAGCASTSSESSSEPVAETKSASAETERKPEPKREEAVATRPTSSTAREAARESTRETERSASSSAASSSSRSDPRTEEANALTRLVAQLNDATREIATLRATNAKLKAGTSAATPAPTVREPDPADAKLAASVKSYAQFRNDLATMFADLEKLRAENAALTTQLKEASSGSKDVKATIAKLESELKVEKSAAAKLESELKAEKAARVQAEQSATKLREQLRVVASAVSGVETAVPESRSRGASAAARRHVLKDGETLERLADRYYGDPAKWRVILDANRGRLPLDGTLPSGLELEIPAK